MNLLAGANEPSSDASDLATSGKPNRSRSDLVPELGKRTCTTCLRPSHRARVGSASVRRSDGEDFSGRNAVSVLTGGQGKHL